jgi:hypothetical protein
MRCEFDNREIVGRLHRRTRASTRRRFPRPLGDVAAVISVACHRANAGGPVFDPIGLRESVRASANPRLMDRLQLRRCSALDALPTLSAAHCQAVQGHGRLFLPCLPRPSDLREPKKKPQSPLRQRLGGSRPVIDRIPPRPYRMKRRRYRKLVARIEFLERSLTGSRVLQHAPQFILPLVY